VKIFFSRDFYAAKPYEIGYPFLYGSSKFRQAPSPLPPGIANVIFSGRLALIPNPFKTSCKKMVHNMLEDAIVDVREAPQFNPVTYSSAAKRGNKEKVIKYINRGNEGVDTCVFNRTRIATNINPEIKSDAPDTSKGVCFSTSLVIIMAHDYERHTM
jgi:hypothetical protein